MVELAVETKNRLKSRLKRKLGFLEDKAKEAVAAYEDFVNLLINVKDFNGQKLFPPPIVDQVWQLHVLDTINYKADCEAMCGCIIHYNPDVDLDSSKRDVRQLSTNIAYDARFGDRLSKSDAWKFDASVPNLPASINNKNGQELAHSIGRGKNSEKPAFRVSIGILQKKKIIATINLTTVRQAATLTSLNENCYVVQTGTKANSLQYLSHAPSKGKSSYSVKMNGNSQNFETGASDQTSILATEPNTQNCSSTTSQAGMPFERKLTFTDGLDGLNVIEMDATKSVRVTVTNGEVYIVYIDKTSKLVDVRSAINSRGSLDPYLGTLWWIIDGERVPAHFYRNTLLYHGIKDLHLEMPSSRNTSGKKVFTSVMPIEVFALSPSLIPATFNLSVKGNGNVIYKIKVTQDTTLEDIKELFISTFNLEFALLEYLCPNQVQMIKQLFTIQLDGYSEKIYAHGGWTVKKLKSSIRPHLPRHDCFIALVYEGKRLNDGETLEQTGVQKGSSVWVLPFINGTRIELHFT